MVIPADLSAKILRLYQAERWRVGIIARQLHVHRDTVKRVLAQAGEPALSSPLRPSRVDPYRDFILQTLAKFPTLTAARLFVMVYERGYRGSPEHFRHVIAKMRPRPAVEAYLRLRTLPGEQAQVDWGIPKPATRIGISRPAQSSWVSLERGSNGIGRPSHDAVDHLRWRAHTLLYPTPDAATSRQLPHRQLVP